MPVPPLLEKADARKVDDLGKKLNGKIKYLHEKIRRASGMDQINDLAEEFSHLVYRVDSLQNSVRSFKGELTKVKNLIGALQPNVKVKKKKGG
jgi:predicted  nucleic acid-binding Zn-ribbon protein